MSVHASDSGFLVTPSGTPYDSLHGRQDRRRLISTGCYRGDMLPSSEWRMHLDFYLAKPDCGAVVHCHSPRATALSCHRRCIPAFHYMVALAGGDRIDCADYASFGTQGAFGSDDRARSGPETPACWPITAR